MTVNRPDHCSQAVHPEVVRVIVSVPVFQQVMGGGGRKQQGLAPEGTLQVDHDGACVNPSPKGSATRIE